MADMDTFAEESRAYDGAWPSSRARYARSGYHYTSEL